MSLNDRIYICGLVVGVIKLYPAKRQVGVLRSSPASPLVRAVEYERCVALDWIRLVQAMLACATSRRMENPKNVSWCRLWVCDRIK